MRATPRAAAGEGRPVPGRELRRVTRAGHVTLTPELAASPVTAPPGLVHTSHLPVRWCSPSVDSSSQHCGLVPTIDTALGEQMLGQARSSGAPPVLSSGLGMLHSSGCPGLPGAKLALLSEWEQTCNDLEKGGHGGRGHAVLISTFQAHGGRRGDEGVMRTLGALCSHRLGTARLTDA